jgi:methyltransferase (TIGR00027 family)
MSSPAPANISDTARLVAFFRARESERADALFHDPWARRLAGERGRALAEHNRRVPTWPMIARTRLMDDQVLAALRAGADRVVNLAAGLDMRPYRLDLPPTLTWIEADLPALMAEKTRQLADETPRCQLVREAVDLADAEARRAFFAQALAGARQALVISEGFIVYLTDEMVRALAVDLHARPEVRWWLVDFPSPKVRRWLAKVTAEALGDDARFRFAPDNGVGFFAPLGFRPCATASLLHAAARFRRLPPLLGIFARGAEPPPDQSGRRHWSGVARLERV